MNIRFVWWVGLTLRGWRFFWHAREARNGEIVFQGLTRGYSRKEDAMHAIDLAKGSQNAPVDRRP